MPTPGSTGVTSATLTRPTPLPTSEDSPSALGYRMPAEWERHAATWLGWPHNTTDWPGKFGPIPWVYGEIVRHLVPGETVRILVNSRPRESAARRLLQRVGVDLEAVQFLRFPTNRGWTRDSGPIFVHREEPEPGLAIVRFHFNAWAKYPDWKKDARLPELAARRFHLPLFDIKREGRRVVLEGGSIDVNGRGTVITTEECLLHPLVQVRNPGFTRVDIETVLCETLGVTNVLWLGRGIAGDDTHGHVDDLCRFVGAHRVVLCRERNPGDANYAALEENRERLEDMRAEDGSSLEVIDLPMPAPVTFDGRRLPASYANFYIANDAVLVPTFNDPEDRNALGILAEVFPDHPVVGIHAVDLVWGLGTLHCLTQQEPAS
jgi:agmatine deiminase